MRIRFPGAHDICQVSSYHYWHKGVDWPSKILGASFSCDFLALNLYGICGRSHGRGNGKVLRMSVRRVDGQ